MLSVTFPTRLSRQLYSKCRAAFPNEEYAVLLGTHSGQEYEIEELYFPGAGGLDPSEADWGRANQMKAATKGRFRLMGIVRVLKKGEKLGCRCRFWPAVDLPVTLK